MAQVVAGIACSHVPMMASPKNWEHLADGERTSLRAGFDRARKILEDSRPDILITFADDHFNRCFFDNLSAFLRTGGLSDWAGPPQTGRVNEEFARWFLERLERGEISEVTTRYARYEDLEAVAGNGGHEIRDWLAVAGAMPPRLRPHVLAYEPLKSWLTGTGIMAWSAD